MTEDGERYLNAIGAALGVALVVAVAIGVLVAMNVPANQPDPPEADWTFRQVNATNVRITHETGESVAAASLVVTVDGYERRMSWTGRVTEGDGVVVQASRHQMVRLYWDGGRSDRIQLASRDGAVTRTATE